MSIKRFDIICPYCGEIADVMAYTRTKKNELRVTYICSYCGSGDVEHHYLYED